MSRPTLWWIVNTVLCVAVVVGLGVVFHAPWQAAVVMAAGVLGGCVVSLVIYRRTHRSALK